MSNVESGSARPDAARREQNRAGATVRNLRWLLTETASKPSDLRIVFWIALSLAFAGLYAYEGLREGFQTRYVVEDDVRQWVFWMERFVDPNLFPNDLIADYYQSTSPLGFTTLYRAMAFVGVAPILLSKILPMFLGLATTVYCFRATTRILPVPAAGFISSLLLNQALWNDSDLASATPRAFLYPIFLAFVYYYLRRSPAGCVVSVALLGLFYPSGIFIPLGVMILGLFHWEERSLRVSRDRNEYYLCAAVLAVALMAMVAYAVHSSGYGPTITAGEARGLPLELAGQRLGFLNESFWTFWLWGDESGLLSRIGRLPFAIVAGLALPLLIRCGRRIPVVAHITGARVLAMIGLASLFMFFAAHALLFRLYLPDRYVRYTVPMLMSIAAGLSLVTVLDAVFRWAGASHVNKRVWGAAGATVLIGALLFSFPSLISKFPKTKWRVGRDDQLYEFLLLQPKDSVVASLSALANNVPTFAKRSVLVAQEYANPYHKSYYLQLHERYVDLLNAQYTTDPQQLRTFVSKYRVSFLVLDRDAFEPKYLKSGRLLGGGFGIGTKVRPKAEEIKRNLELGEVPALTKLMNGCVVFETGGLIVLSTECIARSGVGPAR